MYCDENQSDAVIIKVNLACLNDPERLRFGIENNRERRKKKSKWASQKDDLNLTGAYKSSKKRGIQEAMPDLVRQDSVFDSDFLTSVNLSAQVVPEYCSKDY